MEFPYKATVPLSDSKQAVGGEPEPASAGQDYSVFGLTIRSSVPLPELFPACGGGAPDVTIASGPPLAADDFAPGMTAANGAIVLGIPDIGRFTISGGSSILLEPISGVPERNLRLYLLGSAFGALLHQRGVLPLHANAIEIDGRAVAFMGESGAGKSTLAAWFHDRGHRIVADDVCAVVFDAEGRPVTLPGLPRFRLWQQALEASGRTPDGLTRSYAADDWDKFDVPVAAGTAVATRLPIGAIYVLERGDELRFRRLEGVAAADALMSHTYRGKYVALAGLQRGHWDASVRLAREVPIYSVARPWSLGRLDEYAERILKHARNQAGA
jgi:hypothetical protein